LRYFVFTQHCTKPLFLIIIINFFFVVIFQFSIFLLPIFATHDDVVRCSYHLGDGQGLQASDPKLPWPEVCDRLFSYTQHSLALPPFLLTYTHFASLEGHKTLTTLLIFIRKTHLPFFIHIHSQCLSPFLSLTLSCTHSHFHFPPHATNFLHSHKTIHLTHVKLPLHLTSLRRKSFIPPSLTLSHNANFCLNPIMVYFLCNAQNEQFLLPK